LLGLGTGRFLVAGPIRRKFDAEIQAGSILVVIDAEKEELDAAEPSILRAGATPLPYEQTTALVR
jgi:hypothetical protein